MRNIMKGRALASALIALFSFSACEDDKPITSWVDLDAVARVEITAANLAMLEVDSTIQLQARAYNAANNVLNTPIAWSTNNALVATISNTGLLRTLDDGNVTVTATAGGKTANFQLVVEHKTAAINIVNTPAPMRVAAQHQVEIKILDPHGKVLQREPRYISRNPDIVSISGTGGLTALKPGTATIEVTSEGVTSTFQVTVIANVGAISFESPPSSLRVGETVKVLAVVKDGSGNPLTGRPVLWASSRLDIATVDANGVITGVAPGSATITATSETTTASFIVVIASRAGSIGIWPSLMTVDIGKQAKLTATVYDMNGAELKGEPVVWTSGNDKVFSVDQNGVVKGVGLGNGFVTVTAAGATGSAQVVVPPLVELLLIKPSALDIPLGGEQILYPVAYAGGAVVKVPFTYFTSAPTVASVSDDGVVKGLALGSATITIAAGTKMVNVLVRVVEPVASITVPSPLTVRAGYEHNLNPILKDAHGNVLTGRTITYASDNEWVAGVTTAGRIIAKHAGHAHITVQSEGITQIVQLNVVGGGGASW